LAIGKHGQNVRLASRLIGWDLDIRTKAMIAEETAKHEAAAAPQEARAQEPAEGEKPEKEKKPKKEAKAKKEKKEKKGAKPSASLNELDGVGAKTLELLKGAGFKDLSDIAAAKLEDLVAVKGIGEKKAQKLIEQAKKLK